MTQIAAIKTPQVALYVWIGKVPNTKPGTEQYLWYDPIFVKKKF